MTIIATCSSVCYLMILDQQLTQLPMLSLRRDVTQQITCMQKVKFRNHNGPTTNRSKMLRLGLPEQAMGWLPFWDW